MSCGSPNLKRESRGTGAGRERGGAISELRSPLLDSCGATHPTSDTEHVAPWTGTHLARSAAWTCSAVGAAAPAPAAPVWAPCDAAPALAAAGGRVAAAAPAFAAAAGRAPTAPPAPAAATRGAAPAPAPAPAPPVPVAGREAVAAGAARAPAGRVRPALPATSANEGYRIA